MVRCRWRGGEFEIRLFFFPPLYFKTMAEYYEKSEWNEALAKLMRIDGILRHSYESKVDKNYESWLIAIDGLYMEMIAWFKEDEQKECDKLALVCEQVLMNYKEGKKVNIADLRRALRNYEVQIRRLMKKYGVDLPTTEDPSTAFRRGFSNG